MSLLDSIRYPISDMPTNEEVEALPDEIIQALREQFQFVVLVDGGSLTPPVMAAVLRIYRRQPKHNHLADKMINAVRQAIYNL